nr:D-mannonate oxidoreductase [Raoultella sp. NCTC 9187]
MPASRLTFATRWRKKIHALVAGSNEQERVSALLSLEEIFGNDLPHSAEFVANVTLGLAPALVAGAREAIATALDS